MESAPSRTPWISLLSMLVALCVLAGAVFVASQAAPAVSATEGDPTEDRARATAEDVERWLQTFTKENKLTGEREPTLEPVAEGKQWKLTWKELHAGKGQPMSVHVAHHPGLTVMMGWLTFLPEHTPAPLLRSILQQNYEIFQAKLAVDEHGALVVAYEIPNRLLDREELVANLEEIVRIVQTLAPQIDQHIDAVTARLQQASSRGDGDPTTALPH